MLRRSSGRAAFLVVRRCLSTSGRTLASTRRHNIEPGVEDVLNQQKKTAIITVEDKVGILAEVSKVLSHHKINMTRINSRPGADKRDYSFYIDFKVDADDQESDSKIQQLRESLQQISKTVVIYGHGQDSDLKDRKERHWFPRKLVDLDSFKENIIYGSELAPDHPGSKDAEYRDRRKLIAQIAKEYCHGQKIPDVDYTPQEVDTWRQIYTKLTKLYPTHACEEFNHVLRVLSRSCNFSKDRIPQLNDVSEFLRETTGWRLRPVAGLLSGRDFMNALAFRVFHSTQYLRHHSEPFYTPEPDIVHELVGHVPMLADPAFSRFSQELGIASLGASDVDLQKIERLYWYTVEFGLCKQNNSIRAYGAGILSSFGELEYSLSDKNEKRPLDVAELVADYEKGYPITKFQPMYYVADSFESATYKFGIFTDSMDKDFVARYDPYTQTVDVVDTPEKWQQIADNINSTSSLLKKAIKLANKQS